MPSPIFIAPVVTVGKGRPVICEKDTAILTRVKMAARVRIWEIHSCAYALRIGKEPHVTEVNSFLNIET